MSLSQSTLIAIAVVSAPLASAAELPSASASFDQSYRVEIQPLLSCYCRDCHSGEEAEAEVDLDAFASMADVWQRPKAWQKIYEMLDSGQMPPQDAEQPSDAERAQLQKWVRTFLMSVARETAGDPGPVVLRRLSNAEYNYTIGDLTGVESLEPTREFPVDSAAGEGFTNTGAAQGMSPALVTKYLDAAKAVASHATLYPDGIRFTRSTSRRDLTDEGLAKLRALYARYTTDGGGMPVNLQGIKFDTNQGGLLPLEEYLRATILEREALRTGRKTVAMVADEQQLSAKYLDLLWRRLNETDAPSLFLDTVRKSWQTAKLADVPALVAAIRSWQQLLWKFNVVALIGVEGAPPAWMEAVTPVTNQQDFRLKLPKPVGGEDVVVYLTASGAGDGSESDYVLWSDMRLEGNSQPALNLRDARGWHERRAEWQRDLLSKIPQYLAAVEDFENAAAEEELGAGSDIDVNVDVNVDVEANVTALAAKHGVEPGLLQVWLDYFVIRGGSQVAVQGHFTETMSKAFGYDFINGWGTSGATFIAANSSDQEVHIPGVAKPHSLVTHPTPSGYTALGWRSPIDGLLRVEVSISDAHGGCGNGIEWFLQHRTQTSVRNLGQGEFDPSGSAALPPQRCAVRKGELISLLIGPRSGDYACDLTTINLTITETGGGQRVWDAAKEISGNILQSNPRTDKYGNRKTWHFYQGALADLDTSQAAEFEVPLGSLLAKWQQEQDPAKKKLLAAEVAALAVGPPPPFDGQTGDGQTTPDSILYQQLQSLAVPLDDEQLLSGVKHDPRFGSHPLGHLVDANHLVVKAPSIIEFLLPAELAAERDLVVTGSCDPRHGQEGTVQLQVSLSRPADGAARPSPIVCREGSDARERTEKALADFRELFPVALCYTRIVPVDEVVTALLFYREDDWLKRLMLDEQQSAELDQLWDDLFFVSKEPLQLVVSVEQLREFYTQDRQSQVESLDKMKPIVRARAEAFKKRVVEIEPTHVQSVLDFADRAWRRKLTAAQRQELRELYEDLRASELPHESAIRLLIARVLTAPAFLYRGEKPPAGPKPARVTDLELASRLSYFLWSSLPDEELRMVAETGRLTGDAGRDRESELVRQSRRLLADARTRRLAIHFACQWLHLRDFDGNDDKNEQLFPEFAALRGDMYEETVRFFEDLFRNDGSVLDVFDGDYTFLNEALAKHYGIAEVTGTDWRRVEGVQSQGRGGVLGMATVLASQSGASRTSPILRGTWVSETLLGERLPRPPPNVPQLPETVPTGLTARELIEQHSSVPECAKCHRRIDPYGFALEQYDAIGRLRSKTVSTKTTLVDGEAIHGLSGLRGYLANDRRDTVVRQFCQKLLGYALGREVQLSDEVLLTEMQQKLAASDYRFSVAVEAIVTSRQFQEIRGAAFDAVADRAL